MNPEVETQIRNNISWTKLPSNIRQVKLVFNIDQMSDFFILLKLELNFFLSQLATRKKNMKKQEIRVLKKQLHTLKEIEESMRLKEKE